MLACSCDAHAQSIWSSLQSASSSPANTCTSVEAMPCTASAAHPRHPELPRRQNIACTVQSASLCLTTTPAEELALGLKFWLAPLRVVGAPVDEICMTLLLSLRFMSVVFDELRNLSLGLAARSVPWKRLPPGAGLTVRSCPYDPAFSLLHSPQSRQGRASSALAASAIWRSLDVGHLHSITAIRRLLTWRFHLVLRHSYRQWCAASKQSAAGNGCCFQLSRET